MSQPKQSAATSNSQPGFAHKKSLGQNFLTSPIVPGWMCDAANINTGDNVLEIGPGTGALTDILLARGAHVIAIEADRRALEHLKEKYADQLAAKRLSLIQSDARELDLANLGLKPGKFKVVANIPYYLTGLLLRHCLQTTVQPSTLVFLLQKEVVTRITRAPKESLLSLSVKAFGTPHYYKTVSRGHFHPAPKIDSAILQVTDITLDNFSNLAEAEFFFTIIHLGFGQKRKQLLGNLAQKYPRTDLEQIFTTLKIPLTIRAEDIKLPTWLVLIKQLRSIHQLPTS